MYERKSAVTGKLLWSKEAVRTFGRNIREIRKQKGLTQAKLSRVSGVSASLISTIELGRGENPDFELALMIAVGLGISMSTLFRGVGLSTRRKEEKFKTAQIDREIRRRGPRSSLVRAISQVLPS